MTWPDTERRKSFMCIHHEKLAEDINTIKTDTAVTKERIINLDRRINGAMDGIRSHIEAGKVWRTAIFSTASGLVIAIIASIFYYGVMVDRVNENYKDIDNLTKALKITVEKEVK